MFDTLVVLYIALFFAKGWLEGDTREFKICVVWMLSLGIAMVWAPSIADDIAADNVPIEIAFAVAFVVCSIFLFLLTYALANMLIRKFSFVQRRRMGSRLLGGGFAVLRGLLILVCALFAVERLPVNSNELMQSKFYEWVVH